ncbi:MAG: nuclear transport factor 2 family protein [Proteobacteria bacterium]|nr:nuclear transport factor 2 family protein [Pseudomonadota bacterium]
MMTALGHNDMRPLVDALDENVVWKSNSLPPYFRFGGEHLKREGAVDLLAKVSSEYSFSRYDVDEIAEIDNQVWAICNVEAFHLPTKRKVEGRIAFRVTFRGHKVLTYEGFFDTGAVLHQQGDISPGQ